MRHCQAVERRLSGFGPRPATVRLSLQNRTTPGGDVTDARNPREHWQTRQTFFDQIRFAFRMGGRDDRALTVPNDAAALLKLGNAFRAEDDPVAALTERGWVCLHPRP
jgi:hypothetical protein